MEQDTSIVIPWRGSGDPWREQSFGYVSKHMEPYNPIIADDGSDPFSRSGSKNLGAKQCTSDVVMFVDADTYIPHSQIDEAIELARQGCVAYPFTSYHAMTSGMSKRICSGEVPPDPQLSQWSVDWATGGAMAMPKDLFFSIGAYDEGFIDWGMEDAAILVMARRAGIEIKKVDGNCFHLWHPRAPENPNILANIKKYQTEYLGE